MPHDFAYNRKRGWIGYNHPDDVRSVHINTFNRKHKYKEHYIRTVGDMTHMTSNQTTNILE